MGGVPGALKTTRRFRAAGFPAYFLSLQNGTGNASPSGALREACAGSVRKTIKCQTNRRLAERFLPPGRQAGDWKASGEHQSGSGETQPCLLGQEGEEKLEGGVCWGRGGIPADPSRFNRTLKNKKGKTVKPLPAPPAAIKMDLFVRGMKFNNFGGR